MSIPLQENEAAKICNLRDVHKLPITDIAKIIDRHPSTVFRFLERIKPDCDELQAFKRGETDVLALKRMLRAKTQVRLLDAMADMPDEQIAQMTPKEKAEIDKALSISSGVETDKQLDLQRANVTITFNYFDSASKQTEIDAQLAALGINPGLVLDEPQDMVSPIDQSPMSFADDDNKQ